MDGDYSTNIPFKTIKTSQVLGKMKQIEKEIGIVTMDSNQQWETRWINQWEARWINLKCWLEMYGE